MKKMTANRIFQELLFVETVIREKRLKLGDPTFYWFQELNAAERKRNTYLKLLDKTLKDFAETLSVLSGHVDLELSLAHISERNRKVVLLGFSPYKNLLKTTLAYIYPHLKGTDSLDELVKKMQLTEYKEESQKSFVLKKRKENHLAPNENSMSPSKKAIPNIDMEIERLENSIKELDK